MICNRNHNRNRYYKSTVFLLAYIIINNISLELIYILKKKKMHSTI